jgi:phytoene dehydrogenase-like protein
MVLVPVGHLDDEAAQDFDALQAQARAAVLNRLSEMGLTDLDKHLKFEVSYTPHQWSHLYNLAKGAAFGLSHNFMQVGYLRPHNRHQRYRNLYFVGSSTHPGSGLPMALLSARLTTERIMQEFRVPQPVLSMKSAAAA